MKIYFRNIGTRLPGLSYPEGPYGLTDTSDPWFWVVHPAGNARTFLDDPEYKGDVEHCLDNGGAILFLKGKRYAGLASEEEAEALEREKDWRVHCLRVACSSGSPKIVERIGRFLKDVQEVDPAQAIPWDTVEPAAWPESLVAVYLVLKALEASPKDAARIRQAWSDLDPSWRHQLWKDAWREYHEERGLSDIPWTAAHLPTPENPQVDLPEPAMLSEAVKVLKLSISG